MRRILYGIVLLFAIAGAASVFAVGGGIFNDTNIWHGDNTVQGTWAIGSVGKLKLSVADLTASCAVGEFKADNAGANNELCYCNTANNWQCVAIANGPAN